MNALQTIPAPPRRRRLFTVLLATVAILAGGQARASAVHDVRFSPEARVGKFDPARVVTVRAGDDFSPVEAERSRRLLEATGLYRSARFRVEDVPGGVALIYDLVPYRLVAEAVIEGNFLALKKDLTRVLRSKAGDPYRREEVERDRESLLRYYREEGFTGTVVEDEVEWTGAGARIVYRISEGTPGVIRELTFKGVEHLDVKELYLKLKLSLFTFYRQENLLESLDRLRRYYRSRGFLDVKITPQVEVREGILLPTLTLIDPVKGISTLLPGEYQVVSITFAVQEGRRYRVEFSGLEEFTEEDLRHRVTFFTTGFFDDYEAEESRESILDFYQSRGYYHAAVSYDIDPGEARAVFTVDHGERRVVEAVRYEGITSFPIEEMTARLKTRASDAAGERLLRADHLEKDRRRLRNRYREKGFTQVEVPGPAVLPGTLPGGAVVVFTVVEGARARLRRIEFDGVTAAGPDRLRGVVPFSAGDAYSDGDVLLAKEALLHDYTRRGYARCRVAAEVRISDDGTAADVRFLVTEGPLQRLGRLVIVGNRKTAEEVIRREIPLREGDIFRATALAEGKRNLYGLGFFEDVRVSLVPTVEDHASQDVIVRVRERPTGQIKIGAGYASDEHYRGFIEIGERNLAGSGRGLRLRGKVSSIGHRYDLWYLEPWLFGRDINGETNFYQEKRDELSYDIDRRGLALGVKKELLPRLTLAVKFRYEFVKYDNIEPDLVVEEGPLDPINITSLVAEAGYDRRDSPVSPRRGSYHVAGIEVATPALGGDTAFNKYRLETSWYLPLGERSEFALSLRGGFAQYLGLFDELPLSERFFLGGARGVRGYAEKDIGPRDQGGDPLGGDTFFLGISEYRFTIRKQWRGVFFFDVGNVWTRLSGLGPGGARSSAGAGLRYNTVVGSVRLDYGYKLTPEEGEDRGRWHFTIGYPF